MDEDFHETFKRQLAEEVKPGHPMHGLPVRLIGRGHGDDALFEIQDGSQRVAVVHLVWQGPQEPPWPSSFIYDNLEHWRKDCMEVDHRD